MLSLHQASHCLAFSFPFRYVTWQSFDINHLNKSFCNNKILLLTPRRHTALRLVTSPMYSITLICGAHRRNSRSHVGRVDNGTSNKNGPYTPCIFISAARNAIVCIVFPRPISSASIAPFSLHTANITNQLTIQMYNKYFVRYGDNKDREINAFCISKGQWCYALWQGR